ncbi:MAG: pyridoxamine 5'-phosphate oxidase family protein [Chloroflexota bacterium]
MSTKIAETLAREGVQDLLARPLLARLATCDSKTLQPHVVPVWYMWEQGAVWISTFRATRKVRELQENPKVSVAVDTDEAGLPVRAVIFEGEAEWVTDHGAAKEIGGRIYTRYLGPEGVLEAEPQSWLDDEQHLVLKLVPRRVFAWG